MSDVGYPKSKAMEAEGHGSVAEQRGHDVGYYHGLADAIGDAPYIDTEVFNERMSMETFIAVVFKRGGINLAVQFEKIPDVITDLSRMMVDSPPQVAQLTDANLQSFPGPLLAELNKFIAARFVDDSAGTADFTPDFAAPRYRTFQQGFPRLVKKDSSADSSIPSAVEHLEVTCVQGHFGSVTNGSFAKIAHINCGIGPLLEDDTMSYSHEDDVVAMVRSLIQAANSVLRLNVRVASELSVMKVRADLWILTQHGVPIGAVEVKKPDRSKVGVMHHGRVLGELYDQLLRLDHFYGTHLGIGILITGEEVRVCWRGNDEENVNVKADEIIGGDLFAGADAPPETPSGADGPTEAPHTPRGAGASLDGSAKRRSPPGLSTSPSKLNPRPHMLRPDGTPNADTKVTKMLKEERCMFVSDVVSCCDDTTDAMRLILSALIKMTRVRWAGLADPFADLETRYLICFVKDEQSSFWSRDLKALTKPKWDDMKVLGATHLYAVEDLGHGENGRVWLTATSSGYIYVLKIPRSAVNMEAECENWHNIYPEFKPYVAAEYWSGHTVLRMPHFAAIPEKDRSSFLTHIETCLKDKFDKKGWVHIDVKWRNIGQYTGPDGQAVAVVFDLSLRKKGVDDKNWVSECMRYLRDSL